jgi:hypothetical protein
MWMKALGLLHPLFTVSAIVATGNHWVLDAVGGAVVVGGGFGLTYLFQGPRARTVTAAAQAPVTPSRPAVDEVSSGPASSAKEGTPS